MQDTPDGSYAALEKKGKKQKANLLKELFNGFTNYRIWLLAACYAYSFGVEVCLLQISFGLDSDAHLLSKHCLLGDV